MRFLALLFLLIFTIALLLIILGIAWAFEPSKDFLKRFMKFELSAFILVVLGAFAFKYFNTITVLDQQDFYGDYVIDREYFNEIEADWQYNYCRFTITESDSIYLYITDGTRIIKTFKGYVSHSNPNYHKSSRIAVKMTGEPNQIINQNPTIYRKPFGFHLVFNSPWFYNMYFKKGKWEPIE